jgi:serine/threonine protein kinase
LPEDAQDVAASLKGLPADLIDGYSIVRELHRGGQGIVYQAIQKSTRRKVAIKVMKEGLFASPVEKARFDREVQILGQVRHPNIVTIHGTGVAAGHHYFVMDYVHGQPINWAAVYPRQHYRRAVLPTYPFERKRFWLDRPAAARPPAPTPAVPEADPPDVNAFVDVLV